MSPPGLEKAPYSVFSQAAFDKSRQGIYRPLFVGAFGGQLHRYSPAYPQGQDKGDGFGIYRIVFFVKPPDGYF
jgi:hypothetical protein